MPDKPWKQFERRIARFFGAVRNSLSGRNSKVTSADCIHDHLYIEAKWRASSALFTLFEKVREEANKERKLPVIALHRKGRKYDLICCRAEDLKIIAQYVKPEVLKEEENGSRDHGP